MSPSRSADAVPGATSVSGPAGSGKRMEVSTHPTSERTILTMNIDKDTILNLLRGNGQHDQAAQAQQELPDQVDTDQHAGLLQKFGINPADLIAKFSGGSSGGLGGMLGKLGG